MLVIVNPYHRSVTIDGVEVVQKILEFPNELNHLSTISCTYDDSSKKITQVHDLHRFTSNFIEREYFFEHLPVFVDWFYREKQAQIEDEAKKEQYKQDIEDAYNKTVQAGNTAVTNINTDKTEALNAIESSKITTLNTITSKRAEALNAVQDSKIITLNEITDTTNTSINNITDTTNSSLNNLSSKENEALNKIATDKAEALSTILSDRQSSLDAINSSINKATVQADRSKTEADRSQRYAEQMEAVASVKPATKDSIGLVIIGDNIDVNENGIISIPKSTKATQDEEGNEILEVAGVVTTGDTITNTDGKLDVNLGDSLEIDENGKINVKLATEDNVGLVKIGENLTISVDGTLNATAKPYTLPTASDTVLGGVKVSNGLSVTADGILTVNKATATPLVAGTASVGSSNKFALEDHVHPAQSVPAAATATPKASGTAAVGTSAKYAREDHVHPSQSVPVAATVAPKANGTATVGTSTKFAREDHVHPTDVVSTIIYPNGGKAGSEANVTTNQRIVMTNPYSGYYVSCEAQIKLSNKWGANGYQYLYNGVNVTQGVAAHQLLPDDKIVVQTGENSVFNASFCLGTPHGNTNNGASAPCRVIVTRLGKM